MPPIIIIIVLESYYSPLCTELVPVEGSRQPQERAAGTGRFGLEAMPGRVRLVVAVVYVRQALVVAAVLSAAVASVRLAGGNCRPGEPQPV